MEDLRLETASTSSEDGLLMRLELPSDPKLFCTVRGALERLTEALGLSPEEGRAVTRAVDEVLTNIVRHSYAGRSDGPIGVHCRRTSRPPQSPGPGEGLEIVVSDRGPEVNPDKLRGRALEDIKPGGLGLHLIRESMDEVEYRRVGGVNEFRLVKYFVTVRAHPNP